MEKKVINKKKEPNQVKYTGDWSSDSKLCSISNGYWEDPFFKLFNTKSSKISRTSLICRGYYVRYRVCDYFLRSMLREVDLPMQIVSLGCGMDTTYFRLLPELESLILKFYELDFKSVITAKKSIIRHNETLQEMAGEKLQLLNCDLRHISSLQEALRSCGFDFEKPTIFYSECVVNYLRPYETFKILQWIRQNIPNSIWLAYEQCNANDAFGQIMVSHFLKNGCPLLSLVSAQSKEDQEAELKEADFEIAKVISAWDAFIKIGKENPPYFPSVNKMEQQFDEYEQLLATCLHYSVRIGVNGSLVQCKKVREFLDGFEHERPEPSDMDLTNVSPQLSCLKVKSYPTSRLPKLTSHKSVVMEDGIILTFGGSGENSRRMKHLIASSVDFTKLTKDCFNDSDNVEDANEAHNLRQKASLELHVNTRIISENSLFFERLHSDVVHIPTTPQDRQHTDSVVIFGGRKSPMDPCTNDLIELNFEDSVLRGDGSIIMSSTYQKCPLPRWRHTINFCYNAGEPFIVLFGGKNSEIVFGDFWWLSVEDLKWTQRIVHDSKKLNEPSPRHSHCMATNGAGNLVYLLGGMSEDDCSLCEDSFWIFNCVTDEWSRMKEFDYFTRRVGHVAIIHKNSIILFGGYGADSTYALDFFAMIIDLDTKTIKSLIQPTPREVFLPFGFSACVIKDTKEDCDKVIIFGGGGNCFSFGTHYNQVVFTVALENDTDALCI